MTDDKFQFDLAAFFKENTLTVVLLLVFAHLFVIGMALLSHMRNSGKSTAFSAKSSAKRD